MRLILFLLIGTFCLCATNTPTAEVVRPGKDYALFFAVDKYINMGVLTNPVQDANGIATELENKYGFQTEVVENPTLDEIEDKINAYVQRFSSDDFSQKGQLLIYFSGHGMTYGSNGYFMPSDGEEDRPHRTGLEYDVLRTKINSIACKHILVVIDACYSISFDPKWPARPNRIFGQPGSNEKD